MPYKSDKQRAYLHINEPELAKEWDMKYPERGQRTQKSKNLNKQKQLADGIRKSSASTSSAGSSIGGGTAASSS
jgi:hypothetical protein